MKRMTLAQLENLLVLLQQQGWQLIGPRVINDQIELAEISSLADLPKGLTDRQGPGWYRLEQTPSSLLFNYQVSAKGVKHYLFEPHKTLFTARHTDTGLVFDQPITTAPKRAVIGLRSCDLKAIEILDQVFAEDPDYQCARANLFLIPVNCTTAGEICFCTAMASGPRVRSGYDLALTELCDSRGHRFLVEEGSPLGERLLSALGTPLQAASNPDKKALEKGIAHAEGMMTRQLPGVGLKNRLEQQLASPAWQAIAERCLACGNCTAVCPSCSCWTVTDTSSLDGTAASRERIWDSCFNRDFSWLSSGPWRDDRASRYRQWLLHKLAFSVDQFDRPSCVGCGRCISWCPVGIDITESARQVAGPDPAASSGHEPE